VGEPEALNTQAHSEQPKPRKRFSSIHTSLRSIRILGSVCDTSHSPRENLLGEKTGRGRNELDIDSAVMLPTNPSAGISGLDENPVRTHRSSYARDLLRYIITFVMRRMVRLS
jgi:hypothetical protein